MRAEKATEEEGTDSLHYGDPLQTKGLREVSISNRSAGYVTHSFPGATLIERVVGFMDRYYGPFHG